MPLVRGLLAAALLSALATASAGPGVSRRPAAREESAPQVRAGLQGDRAGFSFCRLAYRSVTRQQGGQGWRTDYPDADHNLMWRSSELTTIGLSRQPDGEPAYSVVQATDDDLFACPFLFASDVGTMGLAEVEVLRLREYLLKGGFLWVDDFWGNAAWDRWISQIARVLPGLEWVELTPEHPLFSTLYRVREVPQIPSIMHWRRSGGGTSERGRESATPHLRALFGLDGRMLVLMSHNTDIADGWEREGEDRQFFHLFSPAAYAIGTNVLVWSMTR